MSTALKIIEFPQNQWYTSKRKLTCSQNLQIEPSYEHSRGKILAGKCKDVIFHSQGLLKIQASRQPLNNSSFKFVRQLTDDKEYKRWRIIYRKMLDWPN